MICFFVCLFFFFVGVRKKRHKKKNRGKYSFEEKEKHLIEGLVIKVVGGV